MRCNGERLRSLRCAAGLSVNGLAAASGVEASTISRIERGLTEEPWPKTVKALADVLGVAVADLALTEVAA